jgi:putative transposase
VVLMIDGIHFGGQVLVVALGIAEGGEKHILGVWQGATENTTVVKGLLEDLVDRGLDLKRRYLVVIDGSKGNESSGNKWKCSLARFTSGGM